MNSTAHPPSGLYKPHQGLKALYYGPDTVKNQLKGLLPSEGSKAYVLTGNSLATRTPLVKQVEQLLGPAHAKTNFSIKQHAPIGDLEAAAAEVKADPSIDTIVSIGGGSPIDSAKWISHNIHENRNSFLFHIAIPTTLSAAECTTRAGYTTSEGLKTTVGGDPRLAAQAILYDPEFARHTPKKLWLATGMRAMDHAVELMYHPSITDVPGRVMSLYSAGALFRDLAAAHASHPNDEINTRLFLAAFGSLQFLGLNITGGLGLSHGLGYALGSPYGIPHGETSCITLGNVVKLQAEQPGHAEQIARLLPYLKPGSNVDAQNTKEAAKQVGDEINGLVQRLGLDKRLQDYGVGVDQVDIITQRALNPTGKAEIPQETYKAVSTLVRSLFEKGSANI